MQNNTNSSITTNNTSTGLSFQSQTFQQPPVQTNNIPPPPDLNNTAIFGNIQQQVPQYQMPPNTNISFKNPFQTNQNNVFSNLNAQTNVSNNLYGPPLQMNQNNMFSNTGGLNFAPQQQQFVPPPTYFQPQINNQYGGAGKNINQVLAKYDSVRNVEDSIQKRETSQNSEKKEKMEIETDDFDYNNDLILETAAPYKIYKPDPENSTLIPIKISLKSQESKDVDLELLNRPGIDLICIVDISGSMSGEKIHLVRKTLNYVLTLLTEHDRMALVVFDDRAETYINLKKVSDENKKMFEEVIEILQDRGGTVVNSGISEGLELLKKRKFQNEVISLFLLSDGYDNIGGEALEVIKKTIKEFNIQESFTIHTFGFGQDHDANLMREIAKAQGGNFYFVCDLKSVDECFVDALGLLFSVLLKDVEILVKVNNVAPLSDMRIKKTYGEMWSYDEAKQANKISLKVLAKGMKKDFICELNIPPCKKPIENEESLIFNITLVGKTINTNTTITKNQPFSLRLTNDPSKDLKEADEFNLDVIVNHFRVKGAEVIENVKVLAEMSKFAEARKLIDDIKKELDVCVCKDHPSLVVLIADLENSRKFLQQNTYNNAAKSHLTTFSYNNMYQQSCPTSNVGNLGNIYGNQMQMKMNSNLKKNNN